MSQNPGGAAAITSESLTPGRAVVTGGAGFIGSHLCARLLDLGCEVVCVDNLATGRRRNLARLEDRPAFSFVEADVSRALDLEGEVRYVLHFASAASPPDYLRLPVETLDVGTRGTRNCLELARARSARFLLASTSEVYGDPQVHPQPETYWGNVNPVGPRSVYDEAKRAAEAYTMAYRRSHGVDTAVVRIFNTYGPGMRPDDGRAIPNFANQALRGEALTVYGDGSQTRSLCFVSDLVEGILRLLASGQPGPVNLGNQHEVTMLQLAETVRKAAGSESRIEFLPPLEDDPKVRRPDTTRARELLGWEAQVPLSEGLPPTLEYFRGLLSEGAAVGSGGSRA